MIQVNVIGHNGSLITQLTDLYSCRAYLVAHQLGGFTIEIPDDIPLDRFPLDALIEVNYAHGEGVNYRNFMSGLIRGRRYVPISADAENLLIYGPGPNDFLARHVVAFDTGTAGAQKTSEADDMMKAYVTANTKDSTRGLGDFFTVDDDVTAGPSITMNVPYANILSALQGISLASKEEDAQVYFDVVRTSAYGFQFRTAMGQIGADRSSGGIATKVFSKEFGNLANVSLDFDFTDEVNAVYAGGQGVGTDRVVVEVSDASRIGASPSNRREAFHNATQWADDSSGGITAAANERLAAGRPRYLLEANVLDTEGSRFGVDWNFGDRIPIQYRGETYTGLIYGVELTLDNDGAEALIGHVRAEGDVLAG